MESHYFDAVGTYPADPLHFNAFDVIHVNCKEGIVSLSNMPFLLSLHSWVKLREKTAIKVQGHKLNNILIHFDYSFQDDIP